MRRQIRFLIFIAILLNSLNLPPSFQPAEAAAASSATVKPTAPRCSRSSIITMRWAT